MSDSGYQDQSPEVIAKEILIALAQKYSIGIDDACEYFDKLQKQIIESKKNNYK